MATNNDGGGPVFPCSHTFQNRRVTEVHTTDGISQRVLLAGMCAASMCGAITLRGDEPHYYTVAGRSLAMADAILDAARQHNGEAGHGE